MFAGKVSDKRDTFLFSIKLMRYLDRNIPSKIFHTSARSEILRISSKTMDLINIVTCVNL